MLLLKLDFSNAFNSIRRDKMLHAVLEKSPAIFAFAHSTYAQPTNLYFGDHVIVSSEGVQQGDPLGPLLFCLTILGLTSSLSSEFRVFYLDDGTLGGPIQDIISDLEHIEQASKDLGLVLNKAKCEFVCSEASTKSAIQSTFPELLSTSPADAVLLGSPIGCIRSIESVLDSKIKYLHSLGDRLGLLHAHDALCLMQHALTLPKLLYVLRTAPCFSSGLLESFDTVQRSLLESVCNISLDDDSWKQASLPINSGVLGIRSATSLAPSAFLASAAGCAPLLSSLLPQYILDTKLPIHEVALQVWSSSSHANPPSGSASIKQKSWDVPIIIATFDSLLRNADARSRARLLASCEKESGAWLTAPPISAVGLRMDDETIRVATGMRVGSSLSEPHSCKNCGKSVDESGLHGLSCWKSQGRRARHSELNQIIHRSLAAIQVPSTLEPRGLYRSDGRRPDGLSLIPWSQGRSLVWDATCRDTFAPSYLHLSSVKAGAVAHEAAAQKCRLYSELCTTHKFIPLAFETSGVFSQDSLAFLKDLALRSRQLNHDPLSYLKLCQRISVCIQRFNCASVLGTCL